jgi:hypothetical protein
MSSAANETNLDHLIHQRMLLGSSPFRFVISVNFHLPTIKSRSGGHLPYQICIARFHKTAEKCVGANECFDINVT